MSRGVIIAILLLSACAEPSATMTRTYRGVLVCTAVRGSPPTTHENIVVHISGSSVTYRHAIIDYLHGEVPIVEAGGGALGGRDIALDGTAVAPGVHVSGRFQLTRSPRSWRLSGNEEWTYYLAGVHFDWPCRANLVGPDPGPAPARAA